MGFSRWQAFVASADECWAICFFGSKDEGHNKQSDLAARGKASIKWQQGCSCNAYSIVTKYCVNVPCCWDQLHFTSGSVKLYSCWRLEDHIDHTPQTLKAWACGLGLGLPDLEPGH